ncbi:MAG: DNA gyrase inhibitor YacG [Nitrospirota bacterium]|nr:DNA gyrase inhibitor YacG [Nitrospirota bacterium]
MRVTCPICRQDATWENNQYRPFCSARCRTADLGAWATESYRITGQDSPGEGQEADSGAGNAADQADL